MYRYILPFFVMCCSCSHIITMYKNDVSKKRKRYSSALSSRKHHHKHFQIPSKDSTNLLSQGIISEEDFYSHSPEPENYEHLLSCSPPEEKLPKIVTNETQNIKQRKHCSEPRPRSTAIRRDQKDVIRYYLYEYTHKYKALMQQFDAVCLEYKTNPCNYSDKILRELQRSMTDLTEKYVEKTYITNLNYETVKKEKIYPYVNKLFNDPIYTEKLQKETSVNQ